MDSTYVCTSADVHKSNKIKIMSSTKLAKCKDGMGLDER